MNGSGTADVVWNDTRAAADRAWRYLDLTGGVRPNLLATIDNGMGRTIAIGYSSSGEMFRMAAAAGRPWKTRLPVATQVVGERDHQRRPRLVEAGGVRLRGRLLRRADAAVPRVRGDASGSSPATTRRRRPYRSTASTSASRRRRSRGPRSASRCRPRRAPCSAARPTATRCTPTARVATAAASPAPIAAFTSPSTSRGPPPRSRRGRSGRYDDYGGVLRPLRVGRRRGHEHPRRRRRADHHDRLRERYRIAGCWPVPRASW